MTELVHYSVDRAIARIELDSPGNRNAISKQLLGELTAHLEAALADESVRAIELTHTGTTFCAGADLAEGAAEGGPGPGLARLLGLLQLMVSAPKPIVASIDGNVRAGGMGLIGACDIVLAGPSSTFALTEVRIGVAPAVIAAVLVPRLTPRAVSRYFLTGETFDPATAERIGLISEAVEDIDKATNEVFDALRKGSPQGLRETKPMTTWAIKESLDTRGEALAELSARLFASDEAREGIMSFLQKRPPSWVL